MNKNTVFSILTFILCCEIAFSSPARRIPVTVTLTNGDTATVVKRGNEFMHWIETVDDGRLVIETEGGTFRLATMDEQKAFFSHPAERIKRAHNGIEGLSPSFPTTGTMRSLVILVNFSDVKMRSETAHDDFYRMLNEEGYSDLGGTGSAADYYKANSMGLFSPTFDVVGPVEMSNGYAYYGQNDAIGNDMRAKDMIIEACRAIDDTVDFSMYDYNNDGFIDNVFVFYAGRGEATSMDASAIWPHSWDISEAVSVPVILDGKQLNHYACSNEIASDERMDGIGTFVHEFGHVLGLPDLYATASTTAFTPNIWTVMDEGEYNNSSRTPPYLTVFERYSLGWMEPIEILKDGCSVVMSHIATNEGYIIPTENPKEFFMLENRQQEGWDAYIPGHGMLVWHIDYDEYLWKQNRVNNSSAHQYVDIIEADNIQSSGTRSGDPFPGVGQVTTFSAQTTPAFVDWNGNDVKAPLTNIKEEDGLIILDVSGGGAPLEPIRYAKPELMAATDITDSSFVAHWQPVDEADGYLVGIGDMKPGEKRRLTTDFTGGIAALDEAWATNVSSTFNNAAYAGDSTPSLRMQNLGDSITCRKDVVYGISFWCRGSNVKTGTEVKVEWLDGETVVATDAYTVTTTGTVAHFEIPASVSANGVRLMYCPAAGSGSIAIDDISVEYADLTFVPMQEECRTEETSLTVGGLQADTSYIYYIVATKGKMRSRQSQYAAIHTAATSGIQRVVWSKADGAAWFNLSGQRVTAADKPGLYLKADGKKVIHTGR